MCLKGWVQTMKQKIIYFACAVWIVMLADFIVEEVREKEAIVVQAMESQTFSDVETTIELSGKYPRELQTGEVERTFINIAKQLGITDNYQIKTEKKSNGTVTIFEKDGENGAVTFRYIALKDSINPEYYMVLNMKLYHNIDCALEYKQRIQLIGQQYGIEGTVCMELEGIYPVQLSMEEKKKAENSIFEQLGAEFISGSRDEDLYTVYGYTNAVKQYFMIEEEKTNINLAFTDNDNMQTVWHLGIPVLWEEY
ncbi:hypothetical protein NDGK_02187 [Clostridiales bacterium CHKCI001]|nr:hypothetical protein NDGK_02187 [Clostridiales bacterium CHKCI001]